MEKYEDKVWHLWNLPVTLSIFLRHGKKKLCIINEIAMPVQCAVQGSAPEVIIDYSRRILKTSVTTFLSSPEDQLAKNMEDCAKMVCHGQHTYVYAQVRRENGRSCSVKSATYPSGWKCF